MELTKEQQEKILKFHKSATTIENPDNSGSE